MRYSNFILISILLLCTKSFSQNAGFFGSPLSSIIYNDGIPKDETADVFNGSDLGLISNLTLNGARISTFENGGANVTDAFIHYQVYEQSSMPLAFNNQDISFFQDLGGGDERWENSSLDIDLIAGLLPGDYTIEIYFSINITGCCSSEAFQSNSGSNYSAIFSIPYRTSSSGNWSDPSTWIGNAVPPPNAEVAILHNVTLNTDATISSLTINNGATFIGSDSNARILSITNDGTITNNGTFNGGSNGTVNFLGSGTVNGTNARSFNDVILQDGGVDFGASSTINGNLMINTDGFVNVGSPIYGSNSTLIYNSGGNYERKSEWSNVNANQGNPVNVTIQNNTQLNLGTENTSNDAVMSGDLFIASNSSLDLNAVTALEADLVIGGNVTNHGTITASEHSSSPCHIQVNGNFLNETGATVNLSNEIGNDLFIQGNFENQGTFNFNDRAIFFTGGNIQTLTAENNFDIPFLIIDKTAGEVQLQQDIIISGTGGNALVMANESVLRLNEHQLQIGNTTDTPFSMTGNARIAGSLSARVLFNSTNTGGTNNLVFSQDAVNHENYLSEFEMQGTGTVAISDTLNILRRFILNDGTFNSDSHLTFKSSDSLTAVIPEVTGGGTISGDVRVERHFPQSNRAFRYISSSVTTSTSIRDNWQEGVNNSAYEDFANVNQNPNPGYGTHITGSTSGANGFDATMSGNKSLYEFDETNQANPWGTGIDNTDTNTITAGKSYALMVRGDRSTTLNSNTAVGPATTLRTTGEIVTGLSSPTISTVSADDFIFIGNPYQAQVDMSQILDEVNSSDFNTNYMWIWDPRIGTPGGLGGYAVVDLTSGESGDAPGNPVPDYSEANQYLQPFQACMLQATGNSPSITFVESAKRDDADQSVNVGTFSENEVTSNALDIELFRSSTQTLFDAVKLKFSSSYTTTPSYEDAVKLWNNTERLAIVNDSSYLSIDKRNLPEANDSIPLYLGNYQTSQYTLKLASTLDDNTQAQLYDHYLQQAIDIDNGNNTYNFTIDQNIPETYDSGRFELIFNPQTLSTEETLDNAVFSLYPNPTRDVIYIAVSTEHVSTQSQMSCFDVMGRQVLSQKDLILKPNTPVDLSSLPSGIYLLKLDTPKHQQNFKIQIE